MRDMRQLSLGETLCKTLSIFFSHLDVYLTIALGATLPVALTTLLFVVSLSGIDDNEDVLDLFADSMGKCSAYILFQTMLSIVLFFTAEAACVRATCEIEAGKSPHWYDCLSHGFRQFSTLVCARLLVWFFLASTLTLVVGLSVALMLSGLNIAVVIVAMLSIAYLGVGFTVWTTTMILYPVIVVEKKGPADAIRRSFALSRGMRCGFFCSVLCLWITKLFVMGTLQGIFLDMSKLSGLISAAGVIVSAVGSLLSLPLTSVLCTVMYMSARGRRGDFSRRQLLQELELEEDNLEDTDREVPLLEDANTEINVAVTPMAQDVIVLDEKEVPADIPEASEVV